MQRIWKIQATRTFAGWKYVFRQGGPMSRELLDCINSDDDNSLLRLFETRGSSPYDYRAGDNRMPFSSSVFLHALLCGKFKIVTMLLTLGLADDGHIESILNPRVGYYLTPQYLSDGSGDLIKLLNRLGYRLNFEDHERFDAVEQLNWAARLMDHRALLTYQKTYFPTYHELPTLNRLQISRTAVIRGWFELRGFPQHRHLSTSSSHSSV